jgi:CheY-like chemotaxis protein
MSQYVLVVDDEELIVTVVADMLETAGFEAHRAVGGMEALAVLDSSAAVDVIVTDVLMPDATGLDVFDAARRRCAQMPVVYVTGYMPDPLRDRLRRDTRTEIVYKPFHMKGLLEAVRAVMAH